MTELTETVDSLPSRPLELDEVDDLAESEGIETILYDDRTVESTGQTAFAYNVVLVLGGSVTGAVYVEDDEQWYRVSHEPRSDATLDAAYEAVREARTDETLFSRSPLTLAEAIFHENRAIGEETSGYVAGDEFDCPVCGETHTVDFGQEEHAADLAGVDASYLYVECPEARRSQLVVEFQARTGRESAPTGE